MRINLVGAFIRNAPFGTEIAFKKGFDNLGEHLVNCIDTSQPNQVWDYDADFTVVFKWIENDQWGELERCSGKKVVYQPDDLRFGHIKEMMAHMRKYCDYALTFDETGAEIAQKSWDYKKTDKLLVTADPDLYHPIPDTVKDIDACFVGSFTGGSNHASRRKMVELVRQIPGIKLAVVHDVFDPHVLNDVYNRSKVVLNHATDVGQPFGYGYGYQCRHFEAGFAGSCLLTNHVLDEAPVFQNIWTFHNEQTLILTLRMLLMSPEKQTKTAWLYRDELMQRHLPIHRAQEMVRFLESL